MSEFNGGASEDEILLGLEVDLTSASCSKDAARLNPNDPRKER
jgi:hypothetical protein